MNLHSNLYPMCIQQCAFCAIVPVEAQQISQTAFLGKLHADVNIVWLPIVALITEGIRQTLHPKNYKTTFNRPIGLPLSVYCTRTRYLSFRAAHLERDEVFLGGHMPVVRNSALTVM